MQRYWRHSDIVSSDFSVHWSDESAQASGSSQFSDSVEWQALYFQLRFLQAASVLYGPESIVSGYLESSSYTDYLYCESSFHGYPLMKIPDISTEESAEVLRNQNQYKIWRLKE